MKNHRRKEKAAAPQVPGDTAPNPNEIIGERLDGESPAQAAVRMSQKQSVKGAITIKSFGRKDLGDLDLMALIGSLERQTDNIKRAGMKDAEGMLITQAYTLDAIFHYLAQQAAQNLGRDLAVSERCLRLALKAQSQSRTTIETLAEVKNPQPTSFIRQQNVGINQQVNNGTPTQDNQSNTRPPARGENENQSNKLLSEGAQRGETLDTGRAGAAVTADPGLEAVGAVNRA